MAEITNLNRFRKQRDRVKKRAKADENTVKFGRTKAQKTLDKARADKASCDLDGARRE